MKEVTEILTDSNYEAKHFLINVGKEESTEKQHTPLEYDKILDKLRIPYRCEAAYLHVGESESNTGWIISVSIVRSQLEKAIFRIAPILFNRNLAFRIPSDNETARMILDGDLGIEQLGKVISVYVNDEILAKSISETLIENTADFFGPKILTDAHIGGCVYCRYGAHKPIFLKDKEGNDKPFFILENGDIVEDKVSIPYSNPPGISWPLDAKNSDNNFLIKSNIKITNIIQVHPKGAVFEGFITKFSLPITRCIIKQGNQYMWSNNEGLDIYDRLQWQYELQQSLYKLINIPKPYGIIKEIGSWYLVMDKIPGELLASHIKQINKSATRFCDLEKSKKVRILNICFEIIKTIKSLHNEGIIHRDITPSNFIVHKRRGIYLIDIELAYSTKKQYPQVPFQLGTVGFMSPEQLNSFIPTTEQDIYALGGTILEILVGLSPLSFQGQTKEKSVELIDQLLKTSILSNLLTSCFSEHPKNRPAIEKLEEAFTRYKHEISNYSKADIKFDTELANTKIENTINSLHLEPVLIHNGLWTAPVKPADSVYYNGNQHTIEPTFYNGIWGILYVIDTAKKLGYSIGRVVEHYKMNFIESTTIYNNQINKSTGVHYGKAGFALALIAGIESTTVAFIKPNLETIVLNVDTDSEDLTVGSGNAGVGLVALRAVKSLKLDFTEVLEKIVQRILNSQKTNSTWITENYHDSFHRTDLFISGDLGIGNFLLQYMGYNNDRTVTSALRNYLRVVCSESNKLVAYIKSNSLNSIINYYPNTLANLVTGTKTLLKAYELLNDEEYRKVALGILDLFPDKIVHENLSYGNGLAGLGMLYLTTYRITNEIKWKNRAHWIANFILSLHKSNEIGGSYWTGFKSNNSYSSISIGNSGILLFLMHFMKDIPPPDEF